MPSSNTRRSTWVSRKRVRRSSSLDETRLSAPPPQEQCPTCPCQTATYIRGMSARERVDMVTAVLRNNHRWSIKDLIYHMVQEPSSTIGGHTEQRRAKLISDAIYKEPKVIAQLADVSKDIYTFGTSDLISRLHTDLRKLERVDIFGEFNKDHAPAKMDIPDLTARAQKAAPELWKLLANIMTPPTRQCDTSEEYGGHILMVCSILASTFAPRSSNNFPMLIGLYLHSMGVKRRVINLLAGLGICPNYRTIINNRDELAKLGEVFQSYDM